MVKNSIHWLNNTGKTLTCAVYHDLIKRRYFAVPCVPYGMGNAYTPLIQSMYYTIRIYDSKDENLLCEYQYICVEKNSYQVHLSEENGKLQIWISYYPFEPGLKRPVYIIGGQANNPENIKEALDGGANGVECDIWVDEDAQWWVNHNEEKEVSLEKWLLKASEMAKEFSEKFAVIIFDTKKVKSLLALHRSVSKELPSNLNVIFSVSNIDKAVAFEEIIPHLLPHQGLAIDEENNVEAVIELFKSKKADRFWYGNGIFAGGLDTQNQHLSLHQAGELRDKGSAIKKTYIWTIEDKETMISYLYDEKVDGLITNSGANGRDFISNALEIINSSLELKKATVMDNIFEVFKK
jgi:glycerophosphoryl diester phosphodiesterase